MGTYLNPGNENFRETVDMDLYVDKSMLLKEINGMLGRANKYICMSRPRRFGKTIAGNMLAAYYSRGCDSAEIFDGLKISGDPDYKKYLNKYNVIWLNLPYFQELGKGIEALLPFMVSELKRDLVEEFQGLKIREDKPLQIILNDIYRQTNEKFIVLIDEWDFIFRESTNSKLQEEYVDFLRVLFKDRPYIKLAYITGILPVKKYNTQSALNNFDEYYIVFD